MTWYAVVTRDKRRLVIERFVSIGAAGNYIVRERRYHEWTVLAQDGGKAQPFRELRPIERKELERTLFPSLFD